VERCRRRVRPAQRVDPPRLQPVPAARLSGRRSVGGLSRRARHRADAVDDRRLPDPRRAALGAGRGRVAPRRGGNRADRDAGRSFRLPPPRRAGGGALGDRDRRADRELYGGRRLCGQDARRRARNARLVFEPAALLPAVAAGHRRSAPCARGDARALAAGDRGRIAVAAFVYPRARGARLGRAAQPRRADARDVDDGRGADGDADPPRKGRTVAARRLRRADRRGAVPVSGGVTPAARPSSRPPRPPRPSRRPARPRRR